MFRMLALLIKWFQKIVPFLYASNDIHTYIFYDDEKKKYVDDKKKFCFFKYKINFFLEILFLFPHTFDIFNLQRRKEEEQKIQNQQQKQQPKAELSTGSVYSPYLLTSIQFV